MPSTSSQSRFFRPALSWLITADPATSRSVRNKISALSSVVHVDQRSVGTGAALKPARCRPAAA